MRDIDPDIDSSYAELVRGKTVAIVGPARTVLGQGQGARIDAHDLVVRFNDTVDLPSRSDLAADIGTRTDILYCNQVILKQTLERGLLKEPLKYVVCTNNSLSFDIASEPRLTRPGPVAARVVRAASATLQKRLQGNWARTGLVAIVDLLSFEPARLFITGMTFYHGGGHLLAPESRELHPLRNRDGSSSVSATGQGHDSYLELDVMRELAREFASVLKMDDALKALLHES